MHMINTNLALKELEAASKRCEYYGKRIIGKTNIERLFLFLTKFKERKVFFNKQLF